MSITKERSCTGKKRYYSIAAAGRAAQDLINRGERVNAYRCPFCPYFHVGHTPRELKQVSEKAA